MNMDLTNIQQYNDGIRQENVIKKKHEYHLIGRQRKVAGHTLFEFNRETKEILPAELKRTVYTDFGTGRPVFEARAHVKQNCFYIQALNKKNAEKKLRKIGVLICDQ